MATFNTFMGFSEDYSPPPPPLPVSPPTTPMMRSSHMDSRHTGDEQSRPTYQRSSRPVDEHKQLLQQWRHQQSLELCSTCEGGHRSSSERHVAPPPSRRMIDDSHIIESDEYGTYDIGTRSDPLDENSSSSSRDYSGDDGRGLFFHGADVEVGSP